MDVGLVTGPTRYIETIREFDNFRVTCAVLFQIKLELEKEFQLKFYVIWNLVSVTFWRRRWDWWEQSEDGDFDGTFVTLELPACCCFVLPALF